MTRFARLLQGWKQNRLLKPVHCNSTSRVHASASWAKILSEIINLKKGVFSEQVLHTYKIYGRQ